MRPIYKYPEQGREVIRTGQAQQSAIVAAADPILRDIEVRSGMVPGANVLQANLMPSGGLSGQEAYLTALRNKLPDYVNAYRAKLTEDNKKDDKKDTGGGSGSGGGTLPPVTGYAPTMPPASSYLPTLTLPDALRNVPYVLSYFGATPMGSDYSHYYKLPPATQLARRMATTRGGRMAVE